MHPGPLLHLEGFLILALSVVFYYSMGLGWITFLVLFMAPDIAILGYLRNARLGALLYNAVHTLAGPLLLISAAVLTSHPAALPYALIWSAHIGMDRALGFGLKYPTSFNDTHLQRVAAAGACSVATATRPNAGARGGPARR